MKQPLNEVLSAAERKIFRLPSRVFFEIHKVFLQTTRFDRQKFSRPSIRRIRSVSAESY